ncbi:RNA helicase [Irpex rosettiformis]|uniref:RNA helicase n=1 Tax=Irpex rosettiformis TaxID=378272 RepID=A0ACB8U3X8_9APHY|nr:RNA helicase [Irpex rosettiformis]
MPAASAFTCALCCVVCPNERAYQGHLIGKKHKSRTQGVNILQCSLCEIAVSGLRSWKSHLKGRKHQNKARSRGVPAGIEPQGAGAPVKRHQFCATCNAYVRDEIWSKHSASILHQRRLRFAAAEAIREEASRDKHGITVSHNPDGMDFGVLEIPEATGGKQNTLTVSNSVPLANVLLLEAKLFSSSSRRVSRLSSFRIAFTGQTQVVYGRPLLIHVAFSQTLRGIYTDRVELRFRDTRLNQEFTIARTLRATVGEQAAFAALQPVAPFVPRKRTARAVERDVVAGEPPPALNAIPYKIKLPQAYIPDRMLPLLSSRMPVADTVRQLQDNFLPRALDEETYGRHYKTLLWAEEYRSDQDLQVYDIESTTLNRVGNLYYLGVPGLAEKRPSVLVGDNIRMQHTSSDPDTGKWYDGFVHVVHRDEVGMKFGASFHAGHSASQRYRARFKLNRCPLRRQHQALDTAFHPSRLLFPEPSPLTAHPLLSSEAIKPNIHNKLIASNPPQLQAIAAIASLPPGSLPFIVFGPPGTGKTVTIVEAIRQLLDRNPNARILACAPSNSAVDLIALRLRDALTPEKMFRFYAPSRFKNQVPDELTDYSLTNANGHFTVPPMATLKRYRVIVSTCVSASFPHGIGMPRGHFSHIFFDEAGHATEPEVMIAAKTMADNDTNIILSGDPKQLGPIIRSAVARELGLEKSYLERLMDRESHNIVTSHGISVVRLVQNFRSHPQILSFPNEQFYDGVLLPCGDPQVINSYIGTSLLVNGKFPIVFRALSGKDDREANSPSFFNAMEVLEVKACVEELRSNREVHTVDGDIGVIAPYHAQCLRIRASLKPVAEGVKVGSVEEFQGQERRVIIISTVRSSRDFVGYDLRHTLGFVANPRRLNVAVTRAQALLIIIGDPGVLALDPLWRSFLNYIHQHGGWKGDEPRWDTSAPVDVNAIYDEATQEAGGQDINELARRMENATLDNLVHEDEEEEDNTDRPWRELE